MFINAYATTIFSAFQKVTKQRRVEEFVRSRLKTKISGQFKIRTSVCPKFRRLITQARQEKGIKNQLLISERIFNKVKNRLNTNHFGDKAFKFCPKIKCPKYKCPEFLVFNVSISCLSFYTSRFRFHHLGAHPQTPY